MAITFRVLRNHQSFPSTAFSACYLLEDNWDDQFRFETTYMVALFDLKGTKHEIGNVKIGQFGMRKGQRRPSIPDAFDALPEGFFSLGQDVSYYLGVRQLEAGLSDQFLEALRDVVKDRELFERALAEDVTKTSLLRSTMKQTVRGQFRRVLEGGVALTPYQFLYKTPKHGTSSAQPPAMDFHVVPDSSPPTNVHVLIGRNGVGKTFILNRMARSLVAEERNPRRDGSFEFTSLELDETPQLFTNLVSVSFSAFDSFQAIKRSSDSSNVVGYTYIGIKRSPGSKGADATKSTYMLGTEFVNAAWSCSRMPKRKRWQVAIGTLSTEAGFSQENLAELFNQEHDSWDETTFKKMARMRFNGLSSGHKIVLLTLTRLVEAVSEKTLVLIDEPEAHLHPPLLAAFVRVLSNLLVSMNGVAIVATHSPVVLQEAPRQCVWKIRRHGTEVVAERPGIETFGENVGILTRDVFGLDLTQAGYHSMISDVVGQGGDYQSVVQEFHGELGGEARAVAQALIANRGPAN